MRNATNVRHLPLLANSVISLLGCQVMDQHYVLPCTANAVAKCFRHIRNALAPLQGLDITLDVVADLRNDLS